MSDLGFCYRWYDSSNGKFYVGSHKGTPDDGYLGGGTLFRRAYAIRPESFTREILYFGEHYRLFEQVVLNYEDAANNDNFYNLVNKAEGGSDKGHKKAESTKRKMSLAAKGKPKSEEHRKKVAKAMIGLTGAKSRRGIPIHSEVLNKTWPTRRECSKDLKVSPSYISCCLNGTANNEKYKFKSLKK